MVLSSRIRFTCDCSTSRCSSRHRGFRRPRCHQMASHSAPLSSTYRGSFSSKMVSWHSSNSTRFEFDCTVLINKLTFDAILMHLTLLGFRQVKMIGASGFSVSKPRAIKCIVLVYILMQPHCQRQSEIWSCLNLAVVANGPTMDSPIAQLICLTSTLQNANHSTHLCIHCGQPHFGTTPTHRTKTA